MRRRLSALSSFYRYCAAHDLGDRIPTAGVARPVVDPDYTATIGLDRGQARALVAAADADQGPQALRTAAVIRLLLHNGLRVDEACAADVANLGTDTSTTSAFSADPARKYRAAVSMEACSSKAWTWAGSAPSCRSRVACAGIGGGAGRGCRRHRRRRARPG